MWKVLKYTTKDFNLENTLLNGQCFNWRKLADNHFEGVYSKFYVQFKRIDEKEVLYQTIPDGGQEFINEFQQYLNSEVNIQECYTEWAKRDSHFAKIGPKISGVRCLRQDPWECTISFICSQNNNIKRITQLLETIRVNFGSVICEIEQDGTKRQIYQFPSIEQLKKATEPQLRKLGFGYRAKYIAASVKMIEEKGGKKWLEGLRGQSVDNIRKELTSLMGVGNKVADCIALFSLDSAGSVPVDTHVFQIAQKLGYVKGLSKKQNLNDKLYVQIVNAFQERFGENAGWAHQIMFAGDLTSFQDKLQSDSNDNKKRKLNEVVKEAIEDKGEKRRKINETTAKKQQRPSRLDAQIMQLGRPELVRPDLATDLPHDQLLKNRVDIDISFLDPKQQRLYLLDKMLFSEQNAKGLIAVPTLAWGLLKQSQWVQFIDNSSFRVSDKSPKVSKISFLTYNVWFENVYKLERYKVIMRILDQSEADFICLQEVVQDFIEMLLSEDWAKQRYFISHMPFEQGYGVMILSKWPCKFYQQRFPSRMGRSLLLCETYINGQTLIVSTAHFESLNSAELRQAQLQLTFPLLKLVDNSFVMGDFNFDSSWKKEQANIDPEFDDIFLTLNAGSEGFTMPACGRCPPWRPDKIVAKKSSKWQPKSINIIGRFSIPSFAGQENVQARVTTPSDHYGLYSVFQYIEKE